jgi:hypothetical protein
MSGAIDIIGDVHGQYDKLVRLLARLGYRESMGAWRHPGRCAVFVGDLIDRGPRQLATVNLVRAMMDAGAARCILGNHEFNAIAWVTEERCAPGHFLRPHTPANSRQHSAFLAEVEGTSEHASIIAWFRTLPLWLDLEPLRVIHACWHAPSMALLNPHLGPGDTLTEELIHLASEPGQPAHEAIEVLCKGPEARLPDGQSFEDKEGKQRHEVRLRWWLPHLTSYREAGIVMPGDRAKLPDAPLPPAAQGYVYDGPPVIFGHYWFSGTPRVISSRFACVDYSAAVAGPLVAYRWEGESELADERLLW